MQFYELLQLTDYMYQRPKRPLVQALPDILPGLIWVKTACKAYPTSRHVQAKSYNKKFIMNYPQLKLYLRWYS